MIDINLIGQKALKIVLILIIGEVSKKAISLLIKKLRIAEKRLGETRLARQEKRLKTIRSLITNTAKIVINFIILMMILAELGVNIAPLITGAGILGLAVGFGAKSLVADLIAGFFIILENQFNIGDTIEAAKLKGKVIKITLRSITLKDKDKKTYIIPNSSIKAVIKYPKKTTS
jgi:small-conductance mechanosensitive channel